MNQAISKLVRTHRIGNGLTLRQAAEQCGITASTLSRIERGVGDPDTLTMRRLSEWAGVPLELALDMPAPQQSFGELLAFIATDGNIAPRYREQLQEIVATAYRVFREMSE